MEPSELLIKFESDLHTWANQHQNGSVGVLQLRFAQTLSSELNFWRKSRLLIICQWSRFIFCFLILLRFLVDLSVAILVEILVGIFARLLVGILVAKLRLKLLVGLLVGLLVQLLSESNSSLNSPWFDALVSVLPSIFCFLGAKHSLWNLLDLTT